MNNYIEQFKRARRASVPLIAIRCPDYSSVMRDITDSYHAIQEAKSAKDIPMLQWDIGRGICGINPAGEEAVGAINHDADSPDEPLVITDAPAALTRLMELMPSAPEFPDGSVVFFLNAHLLLEDMNPVNRMTTIQNIWNLRDAFKSTKRTFVIMCPDIKLPHELINDTVILDVDLPDDAEMEAIVRSQLKAAELKPNDALVKQAVNAVSGLSGFLAENSIAMALRKGGIDIPALWESKIAAIEQSSGLTVFRGNSKFDQVGGLDQSKKYMRYVINGKRKPKLVVIIDEIGDQFAGQNDSNGLNADIQSQFLQNMENNNWRGILFHGFAGTGKTELAKAMGHEAGGLFLWFDIGSTKGGIVGDTEKAIRAAMKILKAMGGNDVFFIGTTNSTANLSAQIKRRFGTTYFFDLLTAEQQAPIWGIHMDRLKLVEQPLPECKGWTGAEIKVCCEKADEFGITLIEAAEFVSPVVDSMGVDGVKAMRATAGGKCLSASAPGYYKAPQPITVRDVLETQKNN